MTITMINGNMVPNFRPSWEFRQKCKPGMLYAGERQIGTYEVLEFGKAGGVEGVRGLSMDGQIEIIGDSAKEVALVIWLIELERANLQKGKGTDGKEFDRMDGCGVEPDHGMHEG